MILYPDPAKINSTMGETVFDFSGDTLSISDNQEIEMNFNVTCVSYSDTEGDLLYYSNGIYIEDASFVKQRDLD